MSTPGQLNTHITPSIGGGYTVSKPGQGDTHITPSFGGGYTVCFAAVIAAKEHRNIAALIAKIAPRGRLLAIALLLIPYFGVFIYLITQSTSMAERSAQQAHQARDEIRRVVGFSVADEIKKLDELKKSGAISDAELHAFVPSSFE